MHVCTVLHELLCIVNHWCVYCCCLLVAFMPFLHCMLASSAVYCNRSCLWVCDSGRAASEPYYSQHAPFASLWALFSLTVSCWLIESVWTVNKWLNNNILSLKVKVVRRLPEEPHVDLAVLAKADHYIGNCISTFSAFAARERRNAGKSVEFWAFDNKQPTPHEEMW